MIEDHDLIAVREEDGSREAACADCGLSPHEGDCGEEARVRNARLWLAAKRDLDRRLKEMAP